MALVVIYGEPGRGKSTAAKQLEHAAGFRRISLDSLYVEFIQKQVASLYFPCLNILIKSHYDSVFQVACRVSYERSEFAEFKGKFAAWSDFVQERTRKALADDHKAVVEGYLAKDLVSDLRQLSHQTLVIEAKMRLYYEESPLSLHELIQRANDPAG